MNRFISNTQYHRGSWLVNAILVMVVIGVVGVVLLPMFAHCGGGSSRSVCGANLHEIGLALQSYWCDYDMMLPSSKLVSGSKKWNKADFLTFGTKIGHGQLVPDHKRETYAEVLWDYMMSKDLRFCPRDPVDKTNPDSQTSYWWKVAVDKAWYGEGCKKPCRREKDYEYPADQVVLYEHMNFHEGETCGLTNGTLVNVVYMDTHVRNATITNATSGDHVNCAANSDGEPMYFNCVGESDKKLANHKTPATFIDPAIYRDWFYGKPRPFQRKPMSGWVWIAGLTALVGAAWIVLRRVGQSRG